MNFICLQFTYWYAIFILIQIIDSLTILSSLKREIRFTTFDVISRNNTIITIQEAKFKQFNYKQTLFVNVTFHKSIQEFEPTFIVSKCKTHYIDCVNVVSYEIRDVCSKIHLLTDFTDIKTTNNHPLVCPLFGEYNFKNISFDADKFGAVFSFPTEKWWESYWKFKVSASIKDRQEICYGYADFYFIEFRSRTRPHKN